MNKALRTILIILLVLAVLCGAFWYFFIHNSGLPASMYASYAAFCGRLGNDVQAARYYNKALALEPNNIDLALETADAFAESGNYTKAEYTLVCSIGRNPEALELYLRLSAVYVAQDKLLDAERLVSSCANPTMKETLAGLRPSAPVIQPDGGYSLDPNEFALSYSGGTAYYSTTREYPSSGDAAYSAPISLEYGITTVTAIVVGDNGLVSSLSTAEFTVCGSIEEVTFQDEAFDAYIRELLSKDRHAAIMTTELWDVQELIIPSEISNIADLPYFVRLKSLTMQTSSVTDFTPLTQLTALSTLDVSGTSLSAAALASIGTVSSLTALTVNNCGLSTLSDFSALTSLNYLDASGNQISDLSPLAGMPGLHELDLSQNSIASIAPLAAESQLSVLNISENPVSSIGALSANTTLVTLNLAACSVDDLSALVNNQALTTLDVSGNQLTSLSGLEGCIALRDLNAATNQLLDLGPLTNLTSLQYLDASGNQLESLPAFPKESALLTINVSMNRLTDVTPLASALALNYLNLNQNRITDLSTIADLPNLVLVDALENPLVGIASLEERSIVVNYDPGYTLPEEDPVTSEEDSATTDDGSGRVGSVNE